jgi:hypothetical protein
MRGLRLDYRSALVKGSRSQKSRHFILGLPGSAAEHHNTATERGLGRRRSPYSAEQIEWSLAHPSPGVPRLHVKLLSIAQKVSGK